MGEISKQELLAALSKLSPDERAAIVGGGVAPAQAKKFGAVLREVPQKDRAELVKLCAAAKKVEGVDAKAFDEAMAAIVAKFPVVASAMQRNNAHRMKPPGHSLSQVILFFAIEEA